MMMVMLGNMMRVMMLRMMGVMLNPHKTRTSGC
jgi:hypothetical protein